MISYTNRGLSFLLKLFKRKGSVFPHAIVVALPNSAITAVLICLVHKMNYMQGLAERDSILKDNAIWNGFSFLVGFLIVFRTSQAYNRFWDGCTSTHRMKTYWFSACSAILSFTKYSNVDAAKIQDFKELLVRMFSMLHAVACAELEDSLGKDVGNIAAFKYHLIDVEGIDEETLNTIKSCPAKTELMFHWIEQLTVENIHTGILSIPAPILSRSFQELSSGLVEFYDAMKISQVPFPFPYAQVCDSLLLLHWCLVPMVACSWVHEIWWGAIFSFVQVFFLWSLTFIAVELENPFGMDENDLNSELMQEESNAQILMLLQPSTQRTPRLSTTGSSSRSSSVESVHQRAGSFHEIWRRIDGVSSTPTPRFDRATFYKALESLDGQEKDRAVMKIRESQIHCASRDTLSIPDEHCCSWEPLSSLHSMQSAASSHDGTTGRRPSRSSVGSIVRHQQVKSRDMTASEPTHYKGWRTFSLPVSVNCKGSEISSREVAAGRKLPIDGMAHGEEAPPVVLLGSTSIDSLIASKSHPESVAEDMEFDSAGVSTTC